MNTSRDHSLSELHPFDQLIALEARLYRKEVAGSDPDVGSVFSGLGFRISDWYFVVPMENLAEVIRSESVTRVPGAKPWFRGVSNLRGTVLSVTDLGVYAGAGPASESLTGRVLVFRGENWLAGLEVDEVFGLRSFRKHERVSNPEAIGSVLDEYRTDAFEADATVWLALDPARILSDSRFRAAAA